MRSTIDGIKYVGPCPNPLCDGKVFKTEILPQFLPLTASCDTCFEKFETYYERNDYEVIKLKKEGEVDNAKHSVCPFNYKVANLGLSRGDAECLLFKNTRDGMRELLDISQDEYRGIYGQMQELISKSEELLYVLERDKEVSEKKWWLDQRAQLAEAIDNAKKC